MPYIPPAEFERATQITLLEYLQACMPDELIQQGRDYITRTHDSLVLSENGLWDWKSRGIGGRSAMKYLEATGMSKYDAAHLLLQSGIIPHQINDSSQTKRAEEKKLYLPPQHTNNNTVIAYLQKRGIHRAVIDYCISHGLLYESVTVVEGREFHNCIFLGCDTKGVPRYAFQRGTGEKRFAGDAEGSDKRYAFSIPGAPGASVLDKTEAAIDTLSRASVDYKKSPHSWPEKHYLSAGGASMLAIDQYLTDHSGIDTLLLCNDNDESGRAMTSRQIAEYTRRGFFVVDDPPPGRFKDYSAYIQAEQSLTRARTER